MTKTKVSKQNMFNIFKISGAASAGLFAGQLPQIFFGAFVFYIGLMIRKTDKTTGSLIAAIGAIFMMNTFLAGGLLANAANA